MHSKVLWRWRYLVIGGLALATALAFFSTFKVSFADGYSLQYRDGKLWQSSETLLLTQQSCALGQITCASQGIPSSPAGASSIAPLYAQIANSGLLRTRVLPGGVATPATGDYRATPVTDGATGGQQLLPFVEFDGLGRTPEQAVRIAERAASVFLAYLEQSTNRSNVPKSNRIAVQVISAASTDGAKVIQGRKLTAPILVFLAVMIVTLGLAYVLENVFPSVGSKPARLIPASSRVDSEAGTPEAAREPGRAAAASADPTN